MAEGVKDLLSRGTGPTIVEWATAIRAVGAGRYQDALEAVREAGRCPAELAVSTWALAEVVEAASRLGVSEQTAEDLRQLAETTQAAGTDWARGVEARCRALVSLGEEAERLYLQAIEHLRCSRVRLELARCHLVYGEWLRPAGRRMDARAQLRTAHEMFADTGAEGFAERARRELLATGETVRKRNAGSPSQLTAQEVQIARLAAENLTNPEIGAQLFISSRTVEWHLRKVYPKLGVSSRRELTGALSALGLGARSATHLAT
ncbi:MAG TPA: LuxR C-terminal-related transcriptional regulator [Sporichthyaceae bacterium]|nr:LuxR C-terminal-related transcriptional regulator [Sporichthyaceae bacterium]